MPRAAVLGSPIAHSLSPILHNAGYGAVGLKDWSYTRFEVTDDTLVPFLEECGPEYRGFSVTMPGKFAALEVAEEQSERAQLIGSANTLVRTQHGCARTTQILRACAARCKNSSGSGPCLRPLSLARV